MNDAEALPSAFVETAYWFWDEDAYFVLRVGESSAAVDALLARLGETSWAYVTPVNPRARPLAPSVNAARLRAFADELASLGVRAFEGVALGLRGDFPPEASVFLPGCAEDTAVALGTRWEQLAVLVGRRGEPARLRACPLP